LELSEKTHEFELGHFRKNHMPFFSAPSSSSSSAAAAAAEILHQNSYYLVSPRFLLYESTILHVIL
jgi:mevalonate pyrophosphate decarboxylase